MEIKSIIDGCLKGNRHDQELLYRRYAAKMYAVCLQYCSNDEEACDVLQDGFIKVFQNLSRYKFEGSFEGWMRRIMVNTALGVYRDKHVLYRVDDIEQLQEFPEETMVEEDNPFIDAEELMAMIKELPPQYRMVFNLYALEGHSHREIGEMLSISEGTSKSNLSRARAILKKKVGSYLELKIKMSHG